MSNFLYPSLSSTKLCSLCLVYSFEKTSGTFRALTRVNGGGQIVVKPGRQPWLTKEQEDLVVQEVTQRGFTSQSLTVSELESICLYLKKKHARNQGRNPFAVKITQSSLNKFIKKVCLRIQNPSSQNARRTEAVCDHRNFISTAVMARVALFKNPIKQTGQINPNNLFNVDATSVRCSKDKVSFEALVTTDAVREVMASQNRSVARTGGGASCSDFFRMQFLMTTSAAGAMLCPIFIIRNGAKRTSLYRIPVSFAC